MTAQEIPRTPRELLEYTEPMSGYWTGKDLLGQVTFWKEGVIGECQRILPGGGNTDEDLDPLNQAQVGESRHASIADQKRYCDEAHARLMAFSTRSPRTRRSSRRWSTP